MRSTHHRLIDRGVNQSIPHEPEGPSWWSRLLDGTHQWGSFDAWVGRYGVRRYRLVIYPPGISTADRQLARLYRGWPITGAVLGLLAVVLFGGVAGSPDTVLAFAVAVYVSNGALLFLRAGPTRVRVRSVSIILMPGARDTREQRRYIECQAVVKMLTRADHMLRAGAISVVEHEATWWQAYNRLEHAHV
jgi:uncharacterized protein DUF6611